MILQALLGYHAAGILIGIAILIILRQLFKRTRKSNGLTGVLQMLYIVCVPKLRVLAFFTEESESLQILCYKPADFGVLLERFAARWAAVFALIVPFFKTSLTREVLTGGALLR